MADLVQSLQLVGGKDAAAPHFGFPLQPMLAQFSQHPRTLGMMTVFPLVPSVRQQQHLTTGFRRAGPLILLPSAVHPRAIPQSLQNARRGQGVVAIVAHHKPLGRRPVHDPHSGGQAVSFGPGEVAATTPVFATDATTHLARQREVQPQETATVSVATGQVHALWVLLRPALAQR